MKHPIFIISFLLITVAAAFFACEKEELIPQESFYQVTYQPNFPEDATLLDWPPGNTLRKDNKDEPNDCQYDDCKDMIQAVLDYYQPIVKTTCKGVKIAFECCNNGNLTIAVVKIKPPPSCAYPNPVFDDDFTKKVLLTGKNYPDGISDEFAKEDPDCVKLKGCKAKITELKAFYQPLVDASCKPMSFRFSCCSKSGQKIRKHLILVPNPAGCHITDIEDSFKGN